jgi:hypothetical protein
MHAHRRFIVATAALSVVLVALVGAAAFVLKSPGELQQRLADAGRPAAPVVDLHDVGQLADAFDQDAGTLRLVVLFSPT